MNAPTKSIVRRPVYRGSPLRSSLLGNWPGFLGNSWGTDVNRLFEDFFDAPRERSLSLGEGDTIISKELASGLHILADLRLTDEAVLLSAELPGLTVDDIELSLDNGYLHIKGERKLGSDVDEEGLLLRERGYGVFHRAFKLPVEVDIDSVVASFEHGVLHVTLPKAAVAKTTKIAIESK